MNLNTSLNKLENNLRTNNGVTTINSIFALMNKQASLELSQNYWNNKNNLILRTE